MNAWRYPLLLALTAAVVGMVVLARYHPETLLRSDGESVQVIALDHTSHTADVWDYLQLGRQLATGSGFTSLVTYVPLLPESVDPSAQVGSVEAFPLLWRPPGYPLLVALAFAIAGGPDPGAVIPLQVVGVVLLVLLTYLLGRVILSRGWAALAALWAGLSPLALGVREPLIATTFHAAAVALAFALVVRARSARGAAIAGIALGLAATLRLETLLLVPACAYILLRGDSSTRNRRLATLLVALFAVILPWWVRTAVITGDPLYNNLSLVFHDTGAFPGWSASQTMAVRETGVLEFMLAHPGQVLAKSGRNIVLFFWDLVRLPHLVLVPFVWFAVVSCRHSRDPRFVYGALAAAGTLCIALAPMEYTPRFTASLVPLFSVIAALGMSRAGSRRGTFATVATVVVAATLALSLRAPGEAFTARRAAREIASLELLGDNGSRAPVVLTDAPEIFAWVWERPAIWAPRPGDIARVEELVGPVAAVVTCADPDGSLADDYVAVGGVVAAPGCPIVIHFAPGREAAP